MDDLLWEWHRLHVAVTFLAKARARLAERLRFPNCLSDWPEDVLIEAQKILGDSIERIGKE